MESKTIKNFLKKNNKQLIVITIFFIAVFVRFYKLGTYPGLHFDEARYGIKAIHIIKGKSIPLVGQLPYSGAYHYYLIAYSLLLFQDITIVSLRFMFAFTNTLSILFIYLALKDFNWKAAVYSSAVLAVSPFHVIFTRIAWDLTISPFCFGLAIYMLSKFIHTRKKVFFYLMFLAVGIGVQSQLITLTYLFFFISFTFITCFNKKGALRLGLMGINLHNAKDHFSLRFNIPKILTGHNKLSITMIVIAIIILIFSFSNMIIFNVENDFPLKEHIVGRYNRNSQDRVSKINELYYLFYDDLYRVLTGNLGYLRTVGVEEFKITWTNPILFAVSIIYIILFIENRSKYPNNFIILFIIYYLMVMPVFLMFFGYTYAVRYFVCFFPLGILPMGLFLAEIDDKKPIIARTVIIGFIMLNLISLGVNFFYTYQITEGTYNLFNCGYGESSHFQAITRHIPKIINRQISFYEPGNPYDIGSVIKYYLKDDYAIYSTTNLDMCVSRQPCIGIDLREEKHTLRMIMRDRSKYYIPKTFEFLDANNEMRMSIYFIEKRGGFNR